MKLTVSLFALSLLLLSACSAHFPVNPALVADSISTPYYLHSKRSPTRSDELLVILAFSGGGMRASALSYGVLKTLAGTDINLHGTRVSLLDEVDLISAVSGGSFTAAYFGLQGRKIFQDFETGFLKHDIETALLLRLLNPKYWFKLGSLYYDRSELAEDYYDDILFHGATFSDLAETPGPAILINATDLTQGTGFSFHQQQFDWICSNIGPFPISRAVAASSAVPGLFSAVSLFNYGGSCKDRLPHWMASELWREQPELAALARKIQNDRDGARRPYIHLMDGGLADNLGLRAVMELVALNGGAQQALDNLELHNTRRILIIYVNAAAAPSDEINRRKNPPSAFFSVDAATTVQINLYNRETLQRFTANIRKWQDEINLARCGRQWCPDDVEFYLVNVGLEKLIDNGERNFLRQLPTTLTLDPDDVDRLIRAADSLLKQSPEFERFIRDTR